METLSCPHCSRLFFASPAILGKRIRCRGCRNIFGVPRQSASESRPESSRSGAGIHQRLGGSLPVAIESLVNGIDVRSCPSCGHAFAMKARLAGATIRCRSCRCVYTVSRANAGDGQRVSAAAVAAGKKAAGHEGSLAEADWPHAPLPAGRTLDGAAQGEKAARNAAAIADGDAGDVVPDTEGGADVPVAFESSPGLVYDRGQSPLGSIIAIVLGGVMAMPLAQLILWWGLGRDPLKIAKKVPAALQWSVPETLRRP